jgi:hypothetical protein
MQHDATATSSTPEPSTSRPSAPRRRRRRVRNLLGIGALVLAASACTPDEIAFFGQVAEPYNEVLDHDQLYRLRWCESTDNYQAVSRGGTFRGAYQFSRSTWDSVASRHFEWLVGIDPVDVEPAWQDLMAKALWSERGRAPWPTCGRRV